MFLGLAAAPIFPLFTLTTGTTRMVAFRWRRRPSAAPRSRRGGPAPRRRLPRGPGPVAARPRPGHGRPVRVHPATLTTVIPAGVRPSIAARARPGGLEPDHLAHQQAGPQGAVRDHRQHGWVVAGGHAVRAVDLELARDDQVHRERHRAARQQADLDVPAAAAQAAHRVRGQGRRAERVDRDVRPAAGHPPDRGGQVGGPRRRPPRHRAGGPVPAPRRRRRRPARGRPGPRRSSPRTGPPRRSRARPASPRAAPGRAR